MIASRMGMLKGNEDLGVLTLNHENAIVLIGMKEVVRKAEKLLKRLKIKFPIHVK